jgi:hypothetical protein
MKNRKKHTNHAVAGVIEALLLVGLVAIVISMIQLQYIPMVMEQREADHMDQVSNQFSTLKSFIEMQYLINALDFDPPKTINAPFSTMLTLSSEPLPYFITAGSYGTISVEHSTNSYVSIDHVDIPLTAIKYEASNVYFVPQTYILEGGGIIVKQPQGTPVMRADPSIRITNNSDNITIDFDIPIFKAVPGKNMTSGVGKCFIRTNYSKETEHYNKAPVNTINISTQYPTAWYELFYSHLGENVNYAIGKSYVRIEKSDERPIILTLSSYDIYVQIGIGWIK